MVNSDFWVLLAINSCHIFIALKVNRFGFVKRHKGGFLVAV